MTESLGEFAYRQLQEWIVTGQFEAGRKLREAEICVRLGISRPPVREAFKALEAEGLIVRRPRRGVYVSRITIQDAREVYSLKAVLYELAVSLAFPHITAGILDQLEYLVHEMGACVTVEPLDTRMYQTRHEAFHSLIIEVAGNRRLQKFASTLHNQISRLSYRSLQNRPHLLESVQYHRAIVDAMKRREEQKTCRLMKEHVLCALEVLVNMQDSSLAPLQLPHRHNSFDPLNIIHNTRRRTLHGPGTGSTEALW